MPQEPTTQRLVALDAFRGFAIAGMLFVNNPGTWDSQVVPRQLLHAEWHGCTFADMIFPFFLFIVGAAMPLSDARRRAQGIPFAECLRDALRRAAVLYLLGAFLASVALNRPVLYFGILQRIGVLYLAAYPLLRLGIRGQALIACGLLAAWWGLMTFGSGPGVDAGSYERDVNFAQHIDRMILPAGNKETVVSLIPGLATVLFGVLTGRLLMGARSHRQALQGLALAAVTGVVVGWLWGRVVPINKILWSSSFAVYTAGWSCLLLLAFFWLFEVRRTRWLAFPLVVFGMNAIAVFVATGLFVRWIMLSWKVPHDGNTVSLTGYCYRSFSGLAGPTAGSLMYSILIVGLGWLFCYWLYRREWFLKV